MTPLPLVYSALIPTPTPRQAADDLPAEDCQLAEGWLEYVVQGGENLLTIANHIGSSLVDLRKANCYDALRSLIAGETILLPMLPQGTLATAVPVFPDEQDEIAASNCAAAALRILSPQPMQELQGVFAIMASNDSADTSAYLIEVRPAWADIFWEYRLVSPTQPNQLLTLINTEVFGRGLHWLRVSQLDENGEVKEDSICAIPVIFFGS